MVPDKLESGADYDGSYGSAESEVLSITNESSFYQNQESVDMGRTETKKKLKKLRSIKISRLPSLRSSTRRAKAGSGCLPIVLSANASSSGRSPNFMKDTSCSDARKESLQASIL